MDNDGDGDIDRQDLNCQTIQRNLLSKKIADGVDDDGDDVDW